MLGGLRESRLTIATKLMQIQVIQNGSLRPFPPVKTQKRLEDAHGSTGGCTGGGCDAACQGPLGV